MACTTLPSLGDQINKQFVHDAFDLRAEFLPEGCVESLITKDSISNELYDDDEEEITQTPDENLLEFVHDKAKKVFAVARCCGASGKELLITMEFFRATDFNDTCLPVTKYTTPSETHPDWTFPFPFDQIPKRRNWKRLNKIWDSLKVKDFYAQQWKFLAPVFSKEEFQHTFEPDCIFPFTWVNNIVKAGMFSHVYEVKIHPKHQQDPEVTVDGQTAHVAIKKIQIPDNEKERDDIEKNYKAEQKALSEITGLQHKHIIQRIAAFTRGDQRYFMFQWADGGNLREFWEDQKRPTLTSELVLHIISQFRGLADALYALHNFKGKGNYRHGDLKPENILRFRDKTLVGILRIADMGLAKHHVDITALRQATSTRYGTVRYEPPEVETNRLDKARSRLYDIWSMGCIILECIIWLLYGCEALDELGTSINATQSRSFFEIKKVDEGLVAEVHPIITQWIGTIAADHQCGPNSAIGDLLNLVRCRLLVVSLQSQAPLSDSDASHTTSPTDTGHVTVTSTIQSLPQLGPYRADAEELRSELDKILQKGRSNEDYLFRAQDRQSIHGLTMRQRLVQTDSFLSPASAEKPKLKKTSTPQALPSTAITEKRVESDTNVAISLQQDYHTLRDHWRFCRDSDFAKAYMKKAQDISHGLSQPKVPRLCQHCQKRDILATGFHLIDTVPDLQRRVNECDFCKLLLEACMDSKQSGSFELHREGSTIVMPGVTKPILSLVYDLDSKPTKYDKIGLQMGFPKLTSSGHRLHFEMLRQWLRDCDQGMAHIKCRQSSSVNLPTRLIDVSEHNIRLCETKGTLGKYIALSHPWGSPEKHRHFCTYVHNIEQHKRGIDFEMLPATFKDAIITTRELGFRYLWIDSICIKQGSDGDFEEESKHMEDVFSSAYCVLAASRATGQGSGFLGPRPERNYVTFNRGQDGNYHVCQQIDDFEGDVVQGNLNKRGWVLQERALARRTLYFTERQTYWECGQGVRCETLTKLENNVAAFLGDPQFPTVAMNASRGAKIHLYQDLYKQYSRLQFSRNEDRPFGIAGLEKRLIHSFKTHGGFGVFDDGGGLLGRSLLWQRASDSTLTTIIFPLERNLKVPTWSWMAYTGGIDYLEPPFAGVDWVKTDIQSPWIDKSPDGAYHTSDRSLGFSLSAVARDFTQPIADQSPRHLIYDSLGSKSDGRVPSSRVVIVGRSKEGSRSTPRTCYVLLVSPKASKHTAGSIVYERMGVGYMPDSWISKEGTPIKIQ